MANVYIEPRPKGRPEGEPIHDYVVEDRHVLHLLICGLKDDYLRQHETVNESACCCSIDSVRTSFGT